MPILSINLWIFLFFIHEKRVITQNSPHGPQYDTQPYVGVGHRGVGGARVQVGEAGPLGRRGGREAPFEPPVGPVTTQPAPAQERRPAGRGSGGGRARGRSTS